MELNKTLRITLIVICVIIIVLNLIVGETRRRKLPNPDTQGQISLRNWLLYSLIKLHGLVFLLSVVGLGFLLIFTEEKKDNKKIK